MEENEVKEKWYFRNWFVVLMLFCIFPIGLILMWTGNKFKMWVRIVITLLLLLFLFIPLEDDSAQVNPTASQSQPQVEQKSIIPQESPEEFKASCQKFNYKEIARNPANYVDQRAVFAGEVIQVQENGLDVVLRVNVTKNDFGWEDTIYVEYVRSSPEESRILENDIVELYGTLKGIKTYETIAGSTASIPYIQANYVLMKPVTP